MKICLAQTKSLKGAIRDNIQNHLQIIEQAIELDSDLIVFPELSITSYEPSLAIRLARTVEDAIFDPFEHLASQHKITIGIGMPIQTVGGVHISMLIFQPSNKRLVYSKQFLHADEEPYFKSGDQQIYLNIKGKKIAIGICYETLQKQHFLNANENGATIYIASVAKSQTGINKANLYFPQIAKEYKTPILMANAVGYCDDFLSAGQSAVWNEKGVLEDKLDNEKQGILIFDTEKKNATER